MLTDGLDEKPFPPVTDGEIPQRLEALLREASVPFTIKWALRKSHESQWIMALANRTQQTLTRKDREAVIKCIDVMVAWATEPVSPGHITSQPLPQEPRSNSGKASETVRSKRSRRTAADTTKSVLAAITLKIQHPGWAESRCAREAGLPSSTLNGHPEWQIWKKKAEEAAAAGRMPKVTREFDKRIDEYVEIDPDSE